MIKAALNQQLVGDRLFVLRLQALLLLIEDAFEVGRGHHVGTGLHHRVGPVGPESIGESAPASHPENQEDKDEHAHQSDGDRVSGRGAESAGHELSSRLSAGSMAPAAMAV